MKSMIGKNLTLSLFGESHGPAIGVVIDGFAPGIKIDQSFIDAQMELRKPKGTISTARQEKDEIKIISGVFNGFTCGTPLCILIENNSQHSSDYEATKHLARPSHADFVAHEKYLGYQDYRGGGHFSGRLTAPLVAAGAICIQMLKDKGIELGSHIAEIHGVKDRSFDQTNLIDEIHKLNELYFACLDKTQGQKMMDEIEKARFMQDSVGGIIETVVVGCPIGLGDPFFHSVESQLSSYLFSVGGVKGIEFGMGFDFVNHFGSHVNDPLRYVEDKMVTSSNYAGGINGGITNGMPIVIRSAIKPTSSLLRTQNTVDMIKKENAEITLNGRHDPCIVHRARIVIDSLVAVCLVDLLIGRYGEYYFGGDPK